MVRFVVMDLFCVSVYHKMCKVDIILTLFVHLALHNISYSFFARTLNVQFMSDFVGAILIFNLFDDVFM